MEKVSNVCFAWDYLFQSLNLDIIKSRILNHVYLVICVQTFPFIFTAFKFFVKFRTLTYTNITQYKWQI